MKQQYRSYQQTIDFLTDAVAKYPHLIKVQSIGESWAKRPIMLATVSMDVAFSDHKPALLYTGTIHAREWIGNELAIEFIQHLLDNHQTDPRITQALTRNTLYMVPCLNPDGFEYSQQHFSFWRKNRRDNGDGTVGVDLNRNFSVNFQPRSNTSSNIYPGPSAFSEPETQAIRDFVLAHKNITIALDYHSQGNVFFPAHKFNHESEIEGTDLNLLCANMNHEIHKVTGRKYGINRGKPPANLIHGSGREYYYSLGIISAVVEVGTRNIPDYLANMSQSVDENIPALRHALSEAINYSSAAPKRVENFTITDITSSTVSLAWEYPESGGDLDESKAGNTHAVGAGGAVHFELYRSDSPKSACTESNLVTVTSKCEFTDIQLNSGQKYYYNIRAVYTAWGVKSPYSPEIKLKTRLAEDEFYRGLFPASKKVGYVGQYTLEKNRDHFGYNSMFVGVNKRKGICYGIVEFDTDKLHDNAKIRGARFCIYPMNRVNAKIENFGEWTLSILDPDHITDITDFNQIHQAPKIETIGASITSDKLTQGIWCHWDFSVNERHIIKKAIQTGKIILRISGPRKLPLGADSQMMQFDIGYGKFGGGIHYRPSLEIIYTVSPETAVMAPKALATIAADSTSTNTLRSGFDAQGGVVYGQAEFPIENLAAPHKTSITEAYLTLKNKNALRTNKDIRFAVEMLVDSSVDESGAEQYEVLQEREERHYIGYEVSNAVLKERDTHHFIFDSHSRAVLEQLYAEGKSVRFVIRTTSSFSDKNDLVDWNGLDGDSACELVIKYIERRMQPLDAPHNLDAAVDGNAVKVTWTNPKHDDFVGSFVVRNRFHPPKSPYDGVKIYAGKDEYTYDRFGNANLPKYYSVFSYDDVPNYSAPSSLYFSTKEVVPVEMEEYEAQDEEMDIFMTPDASA